MREKEMLAVVEALVNQPTAPFHEGALRAEIEAQLREIPHVKFERDGFGNIIAHYQRGRKRAAEWAFAAHMDHPGWVRSPDDEMQFLGSVAARFRSNPKKRSFGDFEMWDLPPFEIRDRQVHSRACDDLLGCLPQDGKCPLARVFQLGLRVERDTGLEHGGIVRRLSPCELKISSAEPS